MQKIYTREKITDFIKSNDLSVGHDFYRKSFSGLYSAACKEFGSWKNAVEASGCDYNSGCLYAKWSVSDAERIIKARRTLKRKINFRHMADYYSELTEHVREKTGSYGKFIEKTLGIKYDEISLRRTSSLSFNEIVTLIGRAEKDNIDISPTGFYFYDNTLYDAIREKIKRPEEFSFITNYDYVLMLCGINPESARQHKVFDKNLFLYELRQHLNEGHRQRWLAKNGQHEFLNFAKKYFGGLRKAEEAVEEYEKAVQFERGVFSHIKKYKERISSLRNISMEGRVKKKLKEIKKNKYVKPERKMIKRDIGLLEGYLLKADRFVTAQDIYRDIGLTADFLADATPTQNIDCISAAGLIDELDKMYQTKKKYGSLESNLKEVELYYHVKNKKFLNPAVYSDIIEAYKSDPTFSSEEIIVQLKKALKEASKEDVEAAVNEYFRHKFETSELEEAMDSVNAYSSDKDILNIETFAKAIKKGIKHMIGIEMAEKDARNTAEFALRFFGYEDRIIDNVLAPKDRNVFYMLEDAKILETGSEEIKLYEDQEWKINYWLLKKRKIKEFLDMPEEKEEEKESYGIYGELPEDVWQRD